MVSKSNGDSRINEVQLSRRIAILSGFALLCFLAIFFRLWHLGILENDRYLAEAQGNQVREITVQAPRGNVLDRNGRPLVVNRTALALRIHPEEMPEEKDEYRRVIRDLGRVVDMKSKAIKRQIRKRLVVAPASPVVLKHDISHETVFYLREHAANFPGVSVDRVYVRDYPRGTLAAHTLGYIREVDVEQLEEARYEALEPGDSLGQDGVEASYDRLLRGINGSIKVQVDAAGRPTGAPVEEVEPRSGNDLTLSLDAKVQAAGEQAIVEHGFGNPGAFVAMKVDTGEIVGIGSFPTYDPSAFSKPILSETEFEQIFGAVGGSYAPIFNRAIGSAYPVGSILKPMTAVAALRDKKLSPNEIINDGGEFKIGDLVLGNAGGAAYGPVDLVTSLQVSSDIYYYILGQRLEGKNQMLQKTLADFGFGSTTGIDLLGEGPGLLPTPEWRNQLYEDGLTDRPWTVGDNVNLSIGQGDFQADPLQMAVSYAALANEGDIVTPHVGLRVANPQGRVTQEIKPPPKRQISLRARWQNALLEGLHAVTMVPGGTAYGTFGGWPIDVAGKTGTAERPPHGDQSWFVSLAPYPDPEIVVVTTIEQGGFGADSAAPAAAEILQAYFGIKDDEIESVSLPGEEVYE